jgi:DNA-binding PadR family transcriptional regulator
MSIKHAILGMLSYRPMAGYDLKKIMQDSTFMPWSGNNNQIYKALVELLEDGFVTGVVELRESAPSKKTYTITRKGLEELKEWTASEPEPLEHKKAFLVRLAWADLMDRDELLALLDQYENATALQLIVAREKMKRGGAFSPRSKREAFLWKMIDDNTLSSYQNELEWIKNVRRKAAEFGNDEVNVNMSFQIAPHQSFIEVFSRDSPLRTEEDALELITLCAEHNKNRLILHGTALSEDFFRLKSGVAGAFLQKFINYSVKVAVILPDESGLGARFRELISETNRSGQYRFFTNRAEAESWITY